MFKRLLSSFGNFIGIADLVCYTLVSLFIFSIWIAYQRAENAAAHAKVIAKLKVEPIKEKINNVIVENKEKIENNENGWNIGEYLKQAKDTAKSITVKNAAGAVNIFNNSVNEFIGDLTGNTNIERNNKANKKPSSANTNVDDKDSYTSF